VNRPHLDVLCTGPLSGLPGRAIFQRAPVPIRPAWSRVEGMMLGLAIGDALGNTSEAQLPGRRRLRHGAIRDYLPNHHVGGEQRGAPSDDSQMAFWTLEQMVADCGYIPEHVARTFTTRRIFGIGSTVREFVSAMREGTPWYQAARESAGNGALMRIVPVVIPHLARPSTELWTDAAVLSLTTHRDPAATASSLAFVSVVWQLLGAGASPSADWFRSEFLEVLVELETGKQYRPRGGWYDGQGGTFSELVARRIDDACERGWAVGDACDAFYSGAYVLETLPCVIYLLMRCAHDPEEAIVRAVNDTYDNDTTAAIVGAAVGALHGVDALPRRWRDGLTGRTGADDDGRMFAILEAASRLYGLGH
jgi:ADP-ribosyl-[dinitrogen reductase] hydrolase